MNGISGQAHEKYLQSIKPYGAYWMKDGVTDAQRLDDIVQCGSARTLYIGFSDANLRAERQMGRATTSLLRSGSPKNGVPAWKPMAIAINRSSTDEGWIQIWRFNVLATFQELLKNWP
jgi:hypothetical protein